MVLALAQGQIVTILTKNTATERNVLTLLLNCVRKATINARSWFRGGLGLLRNQLFEMQILFFTLAASPSMCIILSVLIRMFVFTPSLKIVPALQLIAACFYHFLEYLSRQPLH